MVMPLSANQDLTPMLFYACFVPYVLFFSKLDKGPDPDTVPSIHAGNCYLAQVFSRLVKEAVDLANDLSENGSNSKVEYLCYR